MADITESLELAMQIKGAVAAAVVDWSSGMCLGTAGGEDLDMEVASAAITEVVRSQDQTLASLKLDDQVEDIIAILGKQYHLLRPLRSDAHMFLYVILRRDLANLALALHRVEAVEKNLVV